MINPLTFVFQDRWVVNNFSHHSSVTAILQHPQWPTLQLRRKISRLLTLFKIIHQEYPLSIPPYFTTMERFTRLDILFYLIQPRTHTKTAFIRKHRGIEITYTVPSNMIKLNNI